MSPFVLRKLILKNGFYQWGREHLNTESQNKADLLPGHSNTWPSWASSMGTGRFHHMEESRAGLVLSVGSGELSSVCSTCLFPNKLPSSPRAHQGGLLLPAGGWRVPFFLLLLTRDTGEQERDTTGRTTCPKMCRTSCRSKVEVQLLKLEQRSGNRQQCCRANF